MNKLELNNLKLETISQNSEVKPELIRTILENFTEIFEKSDTEKKKTLLKSLIETISITAGNSSRDRRVDKIKLN